MPRNKEEDIFDSDDEEASDSDHEAEEPKPKKSGKFVKKIAESSIGKQVVNLVTGVEFFVGALRSFRDLIQSCRAFIQEKKEPKDTYKQRRIKKAWICVKDLAAFIAYTASVVVIVAGAIAAIANPFSLVVSMGMLASIVAAGLVVITASILLEKFADKKIKAIDKRLKEKKGYHHDLNDNRQTHLLKSRLKKTYEHGQKRGEAFLEMTDEHGTHGHKNPALFLKKHLDHHPGLLLKAEHHLGADAYEHIAKSTLKLLAHIKGDPNPIYQNIQVRTHSMSSDPQALSVKVPRATTSTDGTQEDHIRRFKDHHGIQIRMNANPSDEALCLTMAAVAQGLGPLKMRPGASVRNILRALEAAKLAHPEVTLKIDPSDRTRIVEHADHKIKDYFHALEHVSARRFQAYVAEEVEKHGERALGKIPDEIPRGWTQRPRNMR